MKPTAPDARAGGERGRRPGVSDPWAAPLERMAAALAYRETGDPFAGTAAAAPAPSAEPAAPPARSAPGHRLSAAMSLAFGRLHLR